MTSRPASSRTSCRVRELLRLRSLAAVSVTPVKVTSRVARRRKTSKTDRRVPRTPSREGDTQVCRGLSLSWVTSSSLSPGSASVRRLWSTAANATMTSRNLAASSQRDTSSASSRRHPRSNVSCGKWFIHENRINYRKSHAPCASPTAQIRCASSLTGPASRPIRWSRAACGLPWTQRGVSQFAAKKTPNYI